MSTPTRPRCIIRLLRIKSLALRSFSLEHEDRPSAHKPSLRFIYLLLRVLGLHRPPAPVPVMHKYGGVFDYQKDYFLDGRPPGILATSDTGAGVAATVVAKTFFEIRTLFRRLAFMLYNMHGTSDTWH